MQRVRQSKRVSRLGKQHNILLHIKVKESKTQKNGYHQNKMEDLIC